MNIAAVLLAAGASTRFEGANKLLAPLGDTPLIRRPAEAVAASRLSEIVVVTGPDADAVMQALTGLRLTFVSNANFADGMGASIAVGVAALQSNPDGVFIVPGDMPGVTSQLIQALTAAFTRDAGARPVFPVLPDGRQTPPVLWPRSLYGELTQLSGQQGGKTLLNRIGGTPVLIEDDRVLIDIDTVDELAAAADTLAGDRA